MFRVDTAGSVSCPLSKLFYISDLTTNTHPRVPRICQVKHLSVKGSVRFMNKTKLFKWTISQDGMLNVFSFGWQCRKIEWHLTQLDWEVEHLRPPDMWWNWTTMERACIVVFWEPDCCVSPSVFSCFVLFCSKVQCKGNLSGHISEHIINNDTSYSMTAH